MSRLYDQHFDGKPPPIPAGAEHQSVHLGRTNVLGFALKLSAVFSALKNYLKPSAWFTDVMVPALQSKKFTKYGLQWEDH